MQKLVINVSENTTELVDETEFEQSIREQVNLEFQEKDAAKIASDSAKQSALAKLSALGLTEEEAKAILGF